MADDIIVSIGTKSIDELPLLLQQNPSQMLVISTILVEFEIPEIPVTSR